MPWQNHCKYSRTTFYSNLLILSVFKAGGSKTHTESVEVIVVPANGSPAHIATLPLIETDIRRFAKPNDSEEKEIFLRAKAASANYDYSISACEPDIRFLPDTFSSGHWDLKSWDFRSVVGIPPRFQNDESSTFRSQPRGLHLFYTLSKNGIPNSTLGNVVCGDVFILKVPNSTKDGLKYYADIEKKDVDSFVLEDLFEELIAQRCKHENLGWYWDQRRHFMWAVIGGLSTQI